MFLNLLLAACYLLVVWGLICFSCEIAGFLEKGAIPKTGSSFLFVVRNQAYFIETVIRKIVAFASFISQASPELPEIIIIDDHSTDETPEILERLQKKYGFCLIRMEGHEPEKKPLEVGLQSCEGKQVYCFFLRGCGRTFSVLAASRCRTWL